MRERAGVDGRLIFPTFCIMLIDYSITLYGVYDGSFGGGALCQTTLLHSSQQFSNCKMKIFFEAEKKSIRNSRMNCLICACVCVAKSEASTTMETK